MKLGQYLKLEREKKGLSQLKIAEEVGVTTQLIHRVETGINKTPPSKENLQKLARGYKVDYEDLVDCLYSHKAVKKKVKAAKTKLKTVPVVPMEMIVDILINEEVINSETFPEFEAIPSEEGYFCATKIPDNRHYPYILENSRIVVKTTENYSNGDWVVLALETLKDISVMVFVEQGDTPFLKSIKPDDSLLGFPVNAEIQRRMLGKVVKITTVKH